MKTDKADPSRRLLVGGMSAGLMTAFASRASAQEGGNNENANKAAASAQPTTEAQPLQDPQTKYPQPPYPEQTQEWPGLVSKMDPRPDHGEDSYKGSGRLAGRRALITGGDSGMGRAAAIAYAREGADVAINYLPEEESDAREVIELIEAEGRKAVALPGDLRERDFCNQLVEDAVRELGGLDILVSNAARQQAKKTLGDISDDEFDWTFKTNVYAMFWLTKAALPHMEPGSAIIVTTSVVAYNPPQNLVDYAMTKAAGRNFVESMAKQLASKGIRINGVAPGPIWTPLQPSGGQLPEDLPQFGSDQPLGRAGQPAELAGIYVLLASDENSYATGQIYGAVGGSGGP